VWAVAELLLRLGRRRKTKGECEEGSEQRREAATL